VNRARSYVFSTGLAPAAAGGAIAALEIMDSDPSLRERLWRNVRLLAKEAAKVGVKGIRGDSPIVPVLTGGAEETMAASARLFERGIFAPGVRPPTVPAGKGRIRATVTAAQEEEDVRALAAALGEIELSF
jgi:7-keto-8-aminopelargonate synthetase-like enzyme